jgi:hypothetical protein
MFQRGAAALASVIVMLGLISLVTLGFVVALLGEQRSLASEERSQLAAMLADSALDQGIAYLRRNAWDITGQGGAGPVPAHWRPCSASNIDPPCGDGTRNLYDHRWLAYADVPGLRPVSSGSCRVHYLVRVVDGDAAAFETVTVLSQGSTRDGMGQARQRVSIRLNPRVSAVAAAPLIAAGALTVSDDVSVVVDDALGKPRSAWASADARFIGASRSCLRSEYLAGAQEPTADCGACRCPDEPTRLLSKAAAEGADVFDRDGNVGHNPDVTSYISDPLLQFFGLSRSRAALLYGEAVAIAGCAALTEASNGLFWIDGPCSIPANRLAGASDAPLVLIVGGGDLSLGAGSRLHGLVIMLPAPGIAAQIDLSESAIFVGALVSAGGMTVSGAGALIHDVPLLRKLAQGRGGLIALAPVPGSWRDW